MSELEDTAARALRFANRMDAAEMMCERYRQALSEIAEICRATYAESKDNPTDPAQASVTALRMGMIWGLTSKVLDP
jgi:hypothetical protein